MRKPQSSRYNLILNVVIQILHVATRSTLYRQASLCLVCFVFNAMFEPIKMTTKQHFTSSLAPLEQYADVDSEEDNHKV